MGKASNISKRIYSETHYKRFGCDLKFALYDEVTEYIKQEGLTRPQFIEKALRVLKP